MAPKFAQCIPELVHRELLPAARSAVLVVGSAARGWANSRSDYDIYVVTTVPVRRPGAGRRPVPLQPSFVPTEALQVGGRRWEVKYWLDTQIDQVLTKVGWPQFERAAPGTELLSVTEESLLERIVSSVALEGEDWLHRRRRQVAGTAFRSFLVARSLAEADGCIDDALGQLEADDRHSAVLSAHRAFGHTVDALLDSQGHYGSQVPKWRARRLQEARPKQLPFERYWRLETMADLAIDDPRPWVEEVVVTCRELALDVEI